MSKFLAFLIIIPLVAGGCVQSPDLAIFLEADKTDEIPYTDDFKCLEFAERLYFNAKEEGLKAGIVFVFFENGDSYHALNVFDVNNDLVFVDCSTGRDAFADVEVGKLYFTSYSKTANGGSSAIASMGGGVVSDYVIVWDVGKFLH